MTTDYNKGREAVLPPLHVVQKMPFSHYLFTIQHLPQVPYCFYKTVTTQYKYSGKKKNICISANFMKKNH